MKALRVLSAVFALALVAAGAPPGTFYGFTPASSDRERTLESEYVDVPSAAGALETATVVAGAPHDAGTKGDYALATYMRDRLQSFGFVATLDTLTARVDSPRHLALTLYGSGHAPPIVATNPHGIFSRHPTPAPSVTMLPNGGPAPEAVPAVTIDLREPPIAGDPDTANPAVGLPFLAGSADGDLAAPLVYAGHGSPADYAQLAAHGIDVRGALAIVRNGREFRGIVARRAQERGIAGLLFYDDPAEDGAQRGAVYPFGPFRPPTSVRRGTLGEGVSIPALPISAANAQLLLGALHGPTAAPPWSGALPVGYPFARGPATARITVALNRKLETLWNTIGILPGTHGDQRVLLGGHRDAWVYGAGDNGSGIVTLLEVARGLGYLAKSGWRPGRTIVVAGWDGEELGSLGSIAYVKNRADDVQDGAVAYLDAEQSVTGAQFGADAAAAIAGIAGEATHLVDDPAQPGTTLYDRWSMRSPALPPRALADGGGDHPPVLFGIGTPSANAGFSGTLGPYHSSYDTLRFATTFSDPGFVLHRTEAQLFGVIALRIADADVVPYRFAAYVPAMQTALRGLAGAARATRTRIDGRGLHASIARFAAAAKRCDAATARAATVNATARELEAARIVDIALYGGDGYARATFPDIAHATALGQADVDRATARTRSAIDRATALLAV